MLFILVFDFLLMIGLIIVGIWTLIFAHNRLTPATRNVWIAFRLLGLALFGSGVWIGWAVFHL